MNNSRHDTWDNNVGLHLVMILLAVAVVWGVTCGWWSLTGAAETHYMSMVKGLLGDGNIFAASLSNQGFDQNQPLAFWLWALAVKAFGGEVNSFAPRMVSVLFAFITLVCTYICGRKLVSPKTGLYGAFILATCPIFWFYAVQMAPDMIFTGFITLSLTATLTRPPEKKVSIARAIIIWGALALAFLTNGILALVMLLIFFILHAITRGRAFNNTMRDLRFVPGIIALAVVIALWLLAGYKIGGESYMHALVQSQLALFQIKLPASHWWFYFAQIGFILGLWIIGFILAVITLIIHKAKFLPRWYIWLFWFAPGFALLCLAPEKNTAYILPVLPPVAIFIGYYISALAQFSTPGKTRIAVSFVIKQLILAIGIIACVTALVIFVQPDFAWRHGFYINTVGIIAAFAAGLVLVFATLRRRDAYAKTGAMFGLVVITLLLGNFVLNATVSPALDVHMSARYFSQNLTHMYPELPDTGLGAVNSHADADGLNTDGARFHVYGNYPLKPVSYAPDMFANAQTPALPDFILLAAQDYAELTHKPQLGGFAPVFWDTLESRLDVVLLKRQTSVITAPNAPMPLIYTIPKPLVLTTVAAVMDTPPAVIIPEDTPETATPDITDATPATSDAAPAAADDAATDTVIEETLIQERLDDKPPIPEHTDAPEALEGPEPAIQGASPDVIIEDTLIQDKHSGETQPAEHLDTPVVPQSTDAVPDTVDEETLTQDAHADDAQASQHTDAPPPSNEALTNDVPVETNDGGNAAENPPEAALGAKLWAWLTPAAAYAQTPQEAAAPESDGLLKDIFGSTTENKVVVDAESLLQALPQLEPEDGAPVIAIPPAYFNNEKCILPQGLTVINGMLRPYLSNCGGHNQALLDVNTYQPNLVRVFSVDMSKGFEHNAYAFNWLNKQGGKFPAEYNLLALNNLTQNTQRWSPFSTGFTKWALTEITRALGTRAIFCPGQDFDDTYMRGYIMELTGLDTTTAANTAKVTKIQMNFGLTDTNMTLEFKDAETVIVEMPR